MNQISPIPDSIANIICEENIMSVHEDRVLDQLFTTVEDVHRLLLVDPVPPNEPEEDYDYNEPLEAATGQLADQQLLLRFRNYNHPWYRHAFHNVPQEYWGPEYDPITRWIPLYCLRVDWYHRMGVPHEVSTRSRTEVRNTKLSHYYVL